MAIIILSVVILFLMACLAVEIGIASWNIRRAKRYYSQKNQAENRVESMKEEVEEANSLKNSLDRYATDISWLLKFLYGRYDKFVDIEKEILEGLKDNDAPVSESNQKYLDLRRALKIIKVTASASEKVDALMGSIADQIKSIIEDLETGDEDKPKPEDTGSNDNSSQETDSK